MQTKAHERDVRANWGDGATYSWTQTVTANHTNDGQSPFVDKAPLYNDAYSANLPGDYTTTFSDSPGLTQLDFSDFHVFKAELSLVRQSASGAYKPVITLSHGVVIAPSKYGGTTTLLPIKVITPSTFHLNAIPK